MPAITAAGTSERGVYWWKKQPNFGDFLTNTLLRELGVPHRWAPPEKADLIVCGSILEHLPRNWKGTVIGAGRLFEDSSLYLTHANILALRGPLSAKGFNNKNIALGDPGLLAPDLVSPQSVAYDLGVVPHWSDTTLAKRFAYGHVIDPTQGPMYVMKEIARCRRVVSSSLHGVIVADAFAIPRQAEYLKNFESSRYGTEFKFRDYAASLGTTPKWGELILTKQSAVQARRKEIADAIATLL